MTARSQIPRRKQWGIRLEPSQEAGYLTLAAVAKCLQAVTWLVARGNEIGASPEDVAEEMNELLEQLHSELQNIRPENILTAAAYFHAKFENIHPFADGNVRTGRLAMNYLLVLHDHPPITIHEEDRLGYYNALEAWDTGQELAPLITFLQTQAEKTWEKMLIRAEKSQA